ncbi:MAG: sodium/solute symporter [Phycisphaerae bacterium]|nr:sodium/solute symporter [Phycisphaerae bacterium]
MHYSDYAVMLVYLAFVVGLGVVFSRKEKDTDEYLLGGRRMPWWVIGVSYMISLMSTISLVAVPGEAYKNGLTRSLMSMLSPPAAILSFYLFVRFYFRVKMFTPFTYLEQRFDRRVRLLGSLVFWWTRLAYLAIVLYSSSKVFQGAANWPVELTICLVGMVGIVYTTLGGMKAVVWTDFTQFVILVVGLALITVKCAGFVDGGMSGIVSYSFSHGRGFEGFKDAGFFSLNPYVRLTFWAMVIAILTEHLFYNSSDQISVQRLLSTSSYQEAKKSLFTFVVLGLPFSIVLWFLGLAVFTYYGQHPGEAEGVTGDTALFRFISSKLPSPMPGLMLSAMLAAVMSTLDSGMNSLAAVATKDIYILFVRKDASERQQVRFSRIMTVLVGVFAIITALVIALVAESIEETILEASTIWISFSIVLAPTFLMGVTTRRVRGNHVIFAMICAWIVTACMVAWYVSSKGGARELSFMYVPLPGFLAMLVLGYIPALLPGEVDRGKTDGLTLWTLDKKG